MKKLTAAQQKVIDSIKASAAKFAGKTYEEAYPRVEDRYNWTKRVYENAQKGRYLVEAHPNTIAALLKAGIIDREGNSLFYWLVEDKKEEETMETKTKITLNTPKTFEREGGRSAVTITKLWRRLPTDEWSLMDDDHATWYRHPEWDEDGKLAFYMPDSVKGQRVLMTEQELNDMINNTKEETTMKTTFTTISGNTFTTNESGTYFYMIDTNGKKIRIKKSEFEAAQRENELERKMVSDTAQAELDKDPCFVNPVADLYTPAVIDENGCVDCRECNVKECVHRNCMRRNPRNVGGLGECPRLDVKPQQEEPDEVQDPELEQIMNETGLEASDAELERNIRNEQKKPARKPRKSKDIAYEGHGKTLTAKQVDFIRHLSDSCFWEHGLESTLWTDVLCDEIGGQFAGKPMTVGAMISTLCEKGLAERAKGKVNNRTATYMVLTELGKKIAETLGLE